MRRYAGLYATLLLAVISACSKQNNTSEQDPTLGTSSAPVTEKAVQIFLDPVTGEVLSEPPATSDGAEAPEVPAEPLDLVGVPNEAGGVTVDLGDNFQSPLVAVIDCNGQVIKDHATLNDIKNRKEDCAASTENKQ